MRWRFAGRAAGEGRAFRGREVRGTGEALESGGIDVAGNGVRRLVEEAFQRVVLAGWHQTQMAVGQGQGFQARQGAQDGDAERGQSGAEQGFVVGAAYPVQDHARDRHVLPEGGEAMDQGCGGLGLRLHVQHQHHGPAREGGQIGGRAGAVGGAVEQAHDALDDQEVGVLFRQPGQRFRPHRPGVEVDAGAAAGRRVEHRVDIIGADLAGGHGDAGPAEMAEQRQHRDGLAAARSRGGEDQAGGRHGSNRRPGGTGRLSSPALAEEAPRRRPQPKREVRCRGPPRRRRIAPAWFPAHAGWGEWRW